MIKEQFQTPPEVVKYMCDMVPEKSKLILEPTKGIGNIVSELENRNFEVYAPDNFFDMSLMAGKFDCIVMNPPFSSKYAFGIPDHIEQTGMRLGYFMLTECLKMSDNVIALMPWFTITDSDVRIRFLKGYGLKSITALPRKTFQYSRIQTCVFELEKGYQEETIFKTFNF